MTRNAIVLVLAATILMAAALGFGAPQASNSLEATLAAMDKASASFKGLTADIRKLSHNDVVEKDDLESGTVAAQRVKSGDTRVLIHISSPEEKYYFLGGGKAIIYTPKSAEAQEGSL